MLRYIAPFAIALLPSVAPAQFDTTMLASQGSAMRAMEAVDEPVAIEDYEGLNAALGGDSVRLCNGYACIGWVEDHYSSGVLKHRGYYDKGQLLIYRNYHSDGSLERDFKAIDNVRSVLRTYFTSGTLRSETKYKDGTALDYSEYYQNGQLRYHEEKHKSEPYYLVMDLFAADGKPISTLKLTDRKTVEFEQAEYWPNGQKRAFGHSRFNPQRMDSQRVGTWTYYSDQGVPVNEEHYIDGKVHDTREL